MGATRSADRQQADEKRLCRDASELERHLATHRDRLYSERVTELEFRLAAERGSPVAAEAALRALPELRTQPILELTLALAYQRAGLEGKANAWRSTALERLLRREPTYQGLIDDLERSNVTERTLQRLLAPSEEKAALFTLLASQFPAQRERLLAEAVRFDYGLNFPHRLLVQHRDALNSEEPGTS